MKDGNILILDDEAPIRELLTEILEDSYNILSSDNGYKALEMLKTFEVDLVLVDINMPVMSGIDFINQARVFQPDVAYIIISGNSDIKTAISAMRSGIWDFIQKPFRDFNHLFKVINGALEKRNLILENKRYKENLEEMVRQRTEELEVKNRELLDSRNRIIGVLSRAAEFKDFETGQHFLRVSHYSGVIAEGCGLDKGDVEIIRQAAPVHDIGKIGIPESILLKQGKLTDQERKEMEKHCLYGLEILQSRSLDDILCHNKEILQGKLDYTDNLLEKASNIAKCHHERVDGSGYPLGMKGDEIPLEARIVAIADVYDALGSARPYKKAWPEEECQKFIVDNAGNLFDKEVVSAFASKIDTILAIKNRYVDELQPVQTTR